MERVGRFRNEMGGKGRRIGQEEEQEEIKDNLRVTPWSLNFSIGPKACCGKGAHLDPPLALVSVHSRGRRLCGNTQPRFSTVDRRSIFGCYRVRFSKREGNPITGRLTKVVGKDGFENHQSYGLTYTICNIVY